MSDKINIRKLDLPELIEQLIQLDEKAFRAKQVFHWLWQKDAKDFADMTELPKNLREKLEKHFFIDHIQLVNQQISNDKTIKCAFQTNDMRIIEGVLIPTKTRMTACISSQVGCSLSCKFCATGKLKLMRNLSAGEIVDQVVYLRDLALEKYGIPLTNIVYMGMGEPLLNYAEVLRSTKLISSADGLGISPRRITLSTAGIIKMIKKLADDDVKFNLAISLHAANELKRSEIMEINDSNNLEGLAEAIRYFHEKTGDRITFEYTLLKDFNDQLKDAQELAEFTKNVPCKVNLIEYNPISEGLFQKSCATRTDEFASYLQSKNLIVNIRRSRGKDIDAACGQLASKSN